MDEFTGRITFVAHDRLRWSRQDVLEAIEAVAFEHAVDRCAGGSGGLAELPVAKFLFSSKRADERLQAFRGPLRLTFGLTGRVIETWREAQCSSAFKPVSGGTFTDTASRCCGSHCQSLVSDIFDHLRSTEGSKACITVHVVRTG